MLAIEGLQPMANEAFSFVAAADQDQCGIQKENVKDIAESGTITLLLMVLALGLIAALFLLWRKIENDFEDKRVWVQDRVGEFETMIEVEYYIDQREEDKNGLDLHERYARRIHLAWWAH